MLEGGSDEREGELASLAFLYEYSSRSPEVPVSLSLILEGGVNDPFHL